MTAMQRDGMTLGELAYREYHGMLDDTHLAWDQLPFTQQQLWIATARSIKAQVMRTLIKRAQGML